jgi:hypothetical protein
VLLAVKTLEINLRRVTIRGYKWNLPTRTIEDEDIRSRDGTCVLGSLPLLKAGDAFWRGEGAAERTCSGERKCV